MVFKKSAPPPHLTAPTMRIRAATPADAQAIARIHVVSWQAAYRGLLPDAMLDALDVCDRARRWRVWLSEDRVETFVAEADGAVIGFCALTASYDEDVGGGAVGEIPVIYLDPAYWRRGHGRALCSRVLRHARSAGFAEVTLWVLTRNSRARRFYEALGFREDGGTGFDTGLTETPLPKVRYRIRTTPISDVPEQ